MATSNSSHQDDHSDRGFRHDIREVRRYVKTVRAAYYDERTSRGGVTTETHQALQTALLRYWDALHEYDDEQVVARKWTEYGIDQIPGLLEREVTVEVDAPGYGPTSDDETRPAISQLSASQLARYTHLLDEIANDLGFTAAAKQGTTRSEITDEMIEEVEEWRQQNLE